MNFARALEGLMAGQVWTRPNWNGKGMWVKVYNPKPFLERGHGDMDCPFFYMKTMGGEHCVWTPNHTDLFANDWLQITDPVD